MLCLKKVQGTESLMNENMREPKFLNENAGDKFHERLLFNIPAEVF